MERQLGDLVNEAYGLMPEEVALMWKNTHPGKTIKSIDVKYDDTIGNQYGLPIVLGITAGTGE